MIFESHAHYDDERFDEDRDTVLMSAHRAGVGIMINAGASIASSEAGIALAQNYEFIYAACGVHPHDVATMNSDDINRLKTMATHKKVVAIGEIGLDYYYDNVDRELQKHWFKQQLILAQEVNLPVIIHSREASKDTFDLMSETKSERVGGVIHCFSGSLETAKKYVELGYFLGIGGVITFKNAKKLIEVVENIPLEYLLVETDAPYLAPIPYRGQRNDSRFIPPIIQRIAQIKNIDPTLVEDVTYENGKRLFFSR